MAKKEWRGINDLYFRRIKDEPKKKPVETEEDSPAKKDEPEIRLIKGTWASSDEELDFNKKCTAKIEAKFLKETKQKRITLDTYVIYKNEEEDLNQSKDVVLNDDGTGEIELTLFYGEKYKQAISENPDDNLCHYIFKAKGKNCSNELESEKLEMPFLPPCVKERQKKKAEMNASGAHGGSACTDDCATCEIQDECLKKTPCDHESECAISASCQENAAKEEA